MSQRDSVFSDMLAPSPAALGVAQDKEDGLLTYFTALNANLENYLPEGQSLHSFGTRLSSGAGVFLLWFGSGPQHQSAFEAGGWSLEEAAARLAGRLVGEDLAVRVKSFLMDVRATEGDSPAVLIAENGLIFYRPQLDADQSAFKVSAADALSIARSMLSERRLRRS